MTFDRDEVRLLGELNGKVDRVLCELRKISERLDKHEYKIEEHDRILERHRSYFKVIGGAVSFILALVAAGITFITSRF